jgi:hypothetical protein
VRRLEVTTFTDLHIYLATNPHHAATLARMGRGCPKRMGCLYRYLFSPAPAVRAPLQRLRAEAATLSASLGTADEGFVAVQVRMRLWRLEAQKAQLSAKGREAAAYPEGAARLRLEPVASPARVVSCMGQWVPPGRPVFFTADETELYGAAARAWGPRLLVHEGGVYQPWQRGGKVDAASLGATEEQQVIKTRHRAPDSLPVGTDDC